MPDQDIDPPADPSRENADRKTPWESIDPDEQAQSAPAPKRRARSNSPRRRAKAAVAEHDLSSSAPVSPSVDGVETGAGGFSETSDDPEEILAAHAFLPDEIETADAENTAPDAVVMADKPGDEAGDEPLVEIFLDLSSQTPAFAATEQTHITAPANLTEEQPAGTIGGVEDAIAEKAFLSDENIPPVDASAITPAPPPASPAVQTEFFGEEGFFNLAPLEAGDLRPLDPVVTNRVYVPPPGPQSDVFGPGDIGFEPAITAAVQSSPGLVESSVTSTPVSHADEPHSADLDFTPLAVTASEVIEPLQVVQNDEAQNSSPIPGVSIPTLSSAAPTVTVPAKAAPSPAITPMRSSPPPSARSPIAPRADLAGKKTPGVQIRYLKPTAGSLDRVPVGKTQDAANQPPNLIPAAESDCASVTASGTQTVPIRYLKPIARRPFRVPESPSPNEIADDSELDPEPELAAPSVTTGGGWTIPLMCFGIGLIACCLIIPQADLNHRLLYERQALQADLDSIQKQVAVNDEFLKQVIDNPTLAERLASRQMKTIRKGQRVLAVKQVNDEGDMSPFALVAVPRPVAVAPYKPVIGTIANLCNNSRSRLYLMGLSMTLVAVGLVCGFSPKSE